MNKPQLSNEKKLKILHFGQGLSLHVQRWVSWWAERGHEVNLISNDSLNIKNVKVHVITQKLEIDDRPRYVRYPTLQFNFLGSLKRVVKVRKLIESIDPDIIHLYSLFFLLIWGCIHLPRIHWLLPWNGDTFWKRYKKGVSL